MKIINYLSLAILAICLLSCGSGTEGESKDATQIQRKYNQMGKVESEISHIN